MPIATSAALGIGGIAASLAGGIGSTVANMSAADRAAAAQDKGLQEWLRINIPDPEKAKLALDRFVSAGELDPKLETAIKQDPSAFEKITTSASDKIAQNRALQELQDIGNSGGMRLQDKAALQEAQLDSNVKARADRDAINADMARRGQGGSGFALAAQLQAQQSGADRDAANSLKIASGAQERALQAIMGAGDMATKFRGQDFSEQSAKAQAADAINRFNTANMQDVQQRNIGSQNRAGEMNLANKQNIMNQNVGLANQEQQYNKELAQRDFQNRMNLAAGKSGQYQAQAQNEMNKGQIVGNAFSNIGGGVGSALGGASKNAYWDEYFAKNKK